MSLAGLLPLVDQLTPAEKLQLMQLLNQQPSTQDQTEHLPRVPGQDKGQVIMADDFDAPLPDAILDSFENSELLA